MYAGILVMGHTGLTDGQLLINGDMLGSFEAFPPRFVGAFGWYDSA